VLDGRRSRRHGGEVAFRRRLRFACALGARRRELQGAGGARIAGGRRRRRLFAHRRGAGLDLPGRLTRLALGGAGRGHGGCLLGSAASRKQAERVDVAVLVGGDSNAEVDVGFRQLGLAARTDRPDRFPLHDGHALGHGHGPEVDERHRVAVGGRDCDGPSATRDGAREGHGARHRRDDVSARGTADVDPAVLARGVRIAPEREWLQYRPVHGPGPGVRGHCAGQDRETDREQDSNAFHRPLPVVCLVNGDSLAG
jgi:hypothetical protein